MSFKFLDYSEDIDIPAIREKYYLNTKPLCLFLAVDTHVSYSNKHLYFYNNKGVYVTSPTELIEILKTDSKVVKYLNLSDNDLQTIILELDKTERFSQQLVLRLIANIASVVNDDIAVQEDGYLRNHFLKYANKLILREAFQQTVPSLPTVSDSELLRSLIATECDLELINIILNQTQLIHYTFLNIRQDCHGFIYPVINILDYNLYAQTQQPHYISYIIPAYLLETILNTSDTLTLQAENKDLLWGSQICPRCMCSISSSLHNSICTFFGLKQEESITVDDDLDDDNNLFDFIKPFEEL